MAESSRVLVTGGAGFIGSHLCETLLRQGRKVLALDNFNNFYDPAIKWRNVAWSLDNPGFSLVEGDIRDEVLVREVISGFKPQAVVHLAAMAGVRPSIQNPLLYNDVNLRGTTVILEILKEFPVNNLLFGSSSSVYGSHDKVPFSEDDKLDKPISPYAATKLAGEQLCFTYHHLYGIPTTCLRFFTVYGPRQRPEMAIHLFAASILKGEPVTIYGDGQSRRDYTYVDDIIDGVVKALDKPRPYDIFNLGESRTVSLQELLILLERALGRKAKVKHEPDQPGDVPLTNADISKAVREIGYAPSTPVEEGIGRFAEWLKTVEN